MSRGMEAHSGAEQGAAEPAQTVLLVTPVHGEPKWLA